MSNQQKQKKDLRDLSMQPFILFTKEDRESADEFLELQSGGGKEEKREKEKPKDGPGIKRKLNKKSKNLQMEEQEKIAFVCDYCDKEFSYSSHLKSHVKAHTGQKDFNFNLCDFSASQKVHLDVHIRRHLKEMNFKCPEMNCGACFVTSTELKAHQSNHNKNKKFPCSLCPYKTDLKSLLTQHMKSIHSESRPFKCTEENCEYSAKQKGHLNVHLNIHSLQKNQVCPHPNCGFKTKHTRVLLLHMKTHSTGEKRFKCRLCQYSSHRSDNLVLHIRRHTGETPFACQLCSYKSKDKSNLIQHMKKHVE